MLDSVGIHREAARSLGRLLPNLQREFADSLQTPAWLSFMDRLHENFEDLFGYLVELYGDQYDFFYHLEQILIMMGQMWLARPDALHDLDAQREKNPTWHQSEQMLGGVCYVDLFAGDLQKLRTRLQAIFVAEEAHAAALLGDCAVAVGVRRVGDGGKPVERIGQVPVPAARMGVVEVDHTDPVSYTHLTLPTSDLV